MQCPYCGKEMELGLVQSPHEIAWLKGDTKHAFAIAAIKMRLYYLRLTLKT